MFLAVVPRGFSIGATNQFNLTTRRYREEQLAELLRSPQWRAWTIRVVDRFGDNGIVGLAMAKAAGNVCEIDNFLLSCRVIGRTVETALLSAVVATARATGARRLLGRFLPTKKNAPAREFYASAGFKRLREESGASDWELDLQEQAIACPPWIQMMRSA